MHKKVSKVIARHVRAQARTNSADFFPDIKALLALEEVLQPLNKAQQNLTQAFTLLVQMKKPRITPDGMVGGRGFVISLKDAKDIVGTTIDNLARVIDAIDDEVSNNPVWKKLKKDREEQESQEEQELDSKNPPSDSKNEQPLTFDELKQVDETQNLPETQRHDMFEKPRELSLDDFEEEVHLTPNSRN